MTIARAPLASPPALLLSVALLAGGLASAAGCAGAAEARERGDGAARERESGAAPTDAAGPSNASGSTGATGAAGAGPPSAPEPGSRAGASDARATAAAPAAEPFTVPAAWRELDVPSFERAALAWLPEGRVTSLAAASLAELTEALGRQDALAVRAAVLLARSGDPLAGAALLARLEARVAGPDRASDAADVTAAAALAHWRIADDVAPRLARLATGETRHPDLEVRVECARAALAMELAPTLAQPVEDFLLALLRAETAAREPAREDWPPTTRLAWAKSRAAEALAARAGVPCTFQADGSYADQAAEAARLEALLRERGRGGEKQRGERGR